MHEKLFKELLQEEKELYLGTNPKQEKDWKKSYHKRYTIWRYLYYFRCCQYWCDVRQATDIGRLQKRLAKMKFQHYNKMRNIYSEKSGVEIGINCKIGKNCDIWHSGVVINGDVGDDCIFHGNNIIGNKGKGHESESPIIGSKVDIGAGAIIIGDLRIADGCIIGAGAVVTKSFEDETSVIVGVPGKKIK